MPILMGAAGQLLFSPNIQTTPISPDAIATNINKATQCKKYINRNLIRNMVMRVVCILKFELTISESKWHLLI